MAWPHCGRTLRADCRAQLVLAQPVLRCPHCRINEWGCIMPLRCEHGYHPEQRSPDCGGQRPHHHWFGGRRCL
eukprot:11210182-Lingulodinium_polyedra.AAC.1